MSEIREQGFERVSVLGGGLLGSSIAMAMKARGVQGEIWARSEKGAREIEETCEVKVTTDFRKAVKDADLVIMATPVGVMGNLAGRLLEEGFQGVVTDVGSVKRLPHDTAGKILGAAGIEFIGSHPMAGSEVKGCQGARLDLLDGAACVLTREGEKTKSFSQLERFWKSMGCRLFEMSPSDHDVEVAKISHFPHLAASMIADLGLESDLGIELSGGGMRDSSRVASGDPMMWAEIMMENRDAMDGSIEEAVGWLSKVRGLLKEGKGDDLERVLGQAKERRDRLK